MLKNETSNPDKKTIGVGMPDCLYLNEFGSQIWHVFGGPPYLVGSALTGAKWRDVDVRMILDDEEYEKWELGDPKNPHMNGKWVALVMAFSELGKKMTGLPIDFQIQQQSYANELYSRDKGHARSAIGCVILRYSNKGISTDEANGT